MTRIAPTVERPKKKNASPSLTSSERRSTLGGERSLKIHGVIDVRIRQETKFSSRSYQESASFELRLVALILPGLSACRLGRARLEKTADLIASGIAEKSYTSMTRIAKVRDSNAEELTEKWGRDVELRRSQSRPDAL